MAQGYNRVHLLGNLGADPELRYTQGGQAVLHARLATTESYLDKDKVRRERTDWHNVVVWGKRGEALAKILAKGSSIFVEGSLRTSSYDDREGQKRYKTEVIANNVILAGSGRGRGGDGDGAEDGAQYPAQGGRGGQGRSSSGQGRAGSGGHDGGRRQDRSRDAESSGGYGVGGGGRAPSTSQESTPDPGYDGSDGGGYGGEDWDIPF